MDYGGGKGSGKGSGKASLPKAGHGWRMVSTAPQWWNLQDILGLPSGIGNGKSTIYR
jgi:hypothetical protein